MNHKAYWNMAVIVLIALAVAGPGAGVGLAEELTEPDPLIGDMKGAYVRLVHNSEGWVVLGYQTANNSLEGDWMLLEMGITLMQGRSNQECWREDVKLVVPGGEVIDLATQEMFLKAGRLKSLNKRGDMVTDSINYFPIGTTLPCRVPFFSDPVAGTLTVYDKFELAYGRACVGRLFFEIPGGIQYGQYHLVVKLDNSTIQVPFKIMTSKEARENFKDWEKMKKESRKKS